MILRNGKMISAREKNLYLEIKEITKKYHARKKLKLKLRIKTRNRKLNI